MVGRYYFEHPENVLQTTTDYITGIIFKTISDWHTLYSWHKQYTKPSAPELMVWGGGKIKNVLDKSFYFILFYLLKG